MSLPGNFIQSHNKQNFNRPLLKLSIRSSDSAQLTSSRKVAKIYFRNTAMQCIKIASLTITRMCHNKTKFNVTARDSRLPTKKISFKNRKMCWGGPFCAACIEIRFPLQGQWQWDLIKMFHYSLPTFVEDFFSLEQRNL